MADTSVSVEEAQNDETKVVSLEKAYVNREERILDPDKLDESSLDRLPKPTGWRLLILPYRGKGKTGGGVFLPDQTIERESVATVCGYVLAVGPLAYKDRNKFGNPDDPHENWQPWCAEKDWVIFGRYSGARFKIDGGEVRILNDDEVIAVIQDPEDILHF